MRIFCMCYLRWTVQEFEEVWNPSNCEIWVLEKVPNTGTYQLSGRWRASPYGGGFSDVKFGKSRKEQMFEHMRTPFNSRSVTPGKADALEGIEMAHMRNLPGPREGRVKAKKRGRLGTGEDVLEYWSKGKSGARRSQAVSQTQSDDAKHH